MPSSALEGKTSLVSGGAGFVGRRLVETLVDGSEVRVLDDLSSGHREWVHDNADLLVGDDRDRDRVVETMAGADDGFPLATQVDVEWSVEALNDSPDGDARVEKTYAPTTAPPQFSIDSPRLTAVYPAEWLRDRLDHS